MQRVRTDVEHADDSSALAQQLDVLTSRKNYLGR